MKQDGPLDECESGVPAIGTRPWGTHCCQLYETADDLVETLVPYFEAGLRNHEACLWITSHRLDAHEARARLAGTVPDLERYVARGQIIIRDVRSWYQPSDDAVVNQWLEREHAALAAGYRGLRLTGDTAWVEQSGWHDFMEYERRVGAAFAPRRILALCTYPLDRCSDEAQVRDLRERHDVTVARRNGRWHTLTNGSQPAGTVAAEHRVRTAPARRVLVVDDNADAAESLAEVIRLFGHAACTAGSGADALGVAARFQPDIVLLDIGLPDLSGFEVAARLRSMPETEEATIVAVTGYGHAGIREQAEQAGFDAHELKPLALETLRDLLGSRSRTP